MLLKVNALRELSESNGWGFYTQQRYRNDTSAINRSLKVAQKYLQENFSRIESFEAFIQEIELQIIQYKEKILKLQPMRMRCREVKK